MYSAVTDCIVYSDKELTKRAFLSRILRASSFSSSAFLLLACTCPWTQVSFNTHLALELQLHVHAWEEYQHCSPCYYVCLQSCEKSETVIEFVHKDSAQKQPFVWRKKLQHIVTYHELL